MNNNNPKAPFNAYNIERGLNFNMGLKPIDIMKYLYTIRNTIDAICKRYPKGDLIIARIGMRTNGDLHLGNLFPIITAVIVGKELITRGYKYKLIVILVDQEINGDDLPFNCLKYSKTKTLAQHSIKIIKKFIYGLVPEDSNFILEYKTVSESQKTKLFRELLIKVIDESKGVIPIYTLCKKCGKLLKNYRKKGINLIYRCDQCNFDYNLNLKDLSEELILEHDLLGAIENNIFAINLHILGSDHEIKNNGSTAMEKRGRYQETICKNVNFSTLLTPLILFRNKKMSKSRYWGIFLREIRLFYKNNYRKHLINFVNENKSKKKITIHNVKNL